MPECAATGADFAVAVAEVLTGSGYEDRVFERGGRPAVYRNLPEVAYAEAQIAAGLPESFARLLADSDRGIARGELSTDSGDLRRLIGRADDAAA